MEPWSNTMLVESSMVCSTILSSDGDYVTFAIKQNDEEKLVEYFMNQNGPRVKLRASNSRSGSRSSTGYLGPCPSGLCGPEWHGLKRAFPPTTHYSLFTCQTTDLHPNYENVIKRKSHIEKGEGKCCSFRFTLSRLKYGEISLVSFARGEHRHTCSGANKHLLRLTPKERMFFMRGILASESVKAFYEKTIVRMIQDCEREGRAPSRLESMTLPEAEKLAKSLGLDNKVKPGEADFSNVRATLLKICADGGSMAFKLPGLSVQNQDTVLCDLAKQYLAPDDLFIFAMTRFQGRLLEKFGKMVSTDGTHMVFSYANIKLIVVMVSSFPLEGDMGERGFPVAIALTISEREDIHRAIVAQMLAAVPNWRPEILMTDMAFSAYNAWSTFFPELKWLWCVFHVWQAWIKRLRHIQRPEGMDKNEWSIVKGHLIHEIKELICPKKNPRISDEGFAEAAQLLSNVMWQSGMEDTAGLFDTYVENFQRWSPPSRWKTVERSFGSCESLPKLARSNNCSEAFFGVLKYDLLNGQCIKTVSAFFDMWIIHQTRIFTNAVKWNVLPHLGSLADCASEVGQQDTNATIPSLAEEIVDPFEVENDPSDDTTGDASDDDDDDDETLKDERKESELSDTELEFDELRKSLEAKQQREELQKTRKIAEDLINQLKLALSSDDVSVSASRGLQRMMMNLKHATTAIQTKDELSLNLVGETRAIEPFVCQKNNFDGRRFDRSESVMNLDLSASATSSQTVGESANLALLQKKKRVKINPKQVTRFQVQSFTEFAKERLANPDIPTRIAEAKAKARESGLPLLRVALNWNTSNRIRAIALDVFKMRFPSSIGKCELISRLITEILSSVGDISGIAKSIADVAIVHTNCSVLNRGDVILLEKNATTNTGEACVSQSEIFSGWIIKPKALSRVEIVSGKRIYWGNLVSRCRDLTVGPVCLI